MPKGEHQPKSEKIEFQHDDEDLADVMSTSANDEANQEETARDINQSETDDGEINQPEPAEIQDSASTPEEASNKCPGNLEENEKYSKVDSGAKDNAEEETLSEYEMKSENDVKEKFAEGENNVSGDSGRSVDGDSEQKKDREERSGLTEGVESENNIEEKLFGEHSHLTESIPKDNCDENSP